MVEANGMARFAWLSIVKLKLNLYFQATKWDRGVETVLMVVGVGT